VTRRTPHSPIKSADATYTQRFSSGTTTTTVLWPFFWDHPGEPVPEENFRHTKADTPTIWLGATPSGLTSAHLHHLPFLQAKCPSFHPTNTVKALEAQVEEEIQDETG